MPKKHKTKVNELTSTMINTTPIIDQIKTGEKFTKNLLKKYNMLVIYP